MDGWMELLDGWMDGYLGESEIGEFDVAEGCDEKVIRFQIAVDDTVAVQILHGQHRLSKVKPRHIARKRTHILLFHYKKGKK